MSSFSTYEDRKYNSLNISVSDELAHFDKLRISALQKAVEMSPNIKEVTIGPNSPMNKEVSIATLEKAEKPNVIEEDLSKDKIAEDLHYSAKLKNHENQIKETTEAVFKNLIDRMIAKRAETMKSYWLKQSEDYERKALELRAKKLQMLKDMRENDNLHVLEKAKLAEKNQNESILNQQAMESMNRILEEQNKATARFASVTDSNTKICVCYNEINCLLQTDQHAKIVCDKYITSLNSIISNINSILDLCKSGAIEDKEVKQAEILASNIENLRHKILKDIEELKQKEILKIKAELLARQQQDEEAKVKELEKQKSEEIKKQKAIEVASQKTQPKFFSNRNYSYYEQLKQYLTSYENQYKDLLDNVNLKKFRFDCQKAVNTPVNALSSVSGLHIKDKYEKLFKLLKGERVQVLDTYVQASQHPQGLHFVTALLAKKIVKQGDLLVSSNPEAAFPLAAVVVALWSNFPELGMLLEAYFHRDCPYLVPMFLPQKEGQTDKEFYISRGYTYNEEGVIEKHDKFLKRMSGIFQLRCAIWIAKCPRFLNASNPHSLKYGWQWLASFINLKPEPDICATLIHDFLTVCGAEFHKHYGKQFIKIIQLINTDYLKVLEDIDEGGPKTRLEVFLQNLLKTGHIPPPSGLLPPNTW